MKNAKAVELELKPVEKKLIDKIRSIECGEIELIKIQNSLPIYYRISLQTELFDIA